MRKVRKNGKIRTDRREKKWKRQNLESRRVSGHREIGKSCSQNVHRIIGITQ